MCRKTLCLHERACSQACKVLWFYLFIKTECAKEPGLSRGQDQLHVGVVACVAQFWGVGRCHRKPSLGSARGCESNAGSAGCSSLGWLSLFIWYFLLPPCPLAFAWPWAPPGLLFSLSLGALLITFTATHFKIWGKKYGEVSCFNVCCSWKGYASDQGSRSK